MPPSPLRRCAFAFGLLLPLAGLAGCGDAPNEERIADLEEEVEDLEDRVEALEERIEQLGAQ